MTVSGRDVGAKDLVLYHNGTIIADIKGKTHWLRASEVVRIGDAWKLTSVPVVIDSQKPTESMAVLVPSLDQKMIAHEGQEDSTVEPTEEIQTLVAQLQKHDEGLPKGEAAPRAMIAYHTKRSELCARIGSKSMKPANREHWYKQSADSIDAAIQTNDYPQGIAILEQYSDQFAKTSWGKRLAAYFKYRALNASYAMEVAKSTEQAKVQDKFRQLVEFIQSVPGVRRRRRGSGRWQRHEFAKKDHEALLLAARRRASKTFAKATERSSISTSVVTSPGRQRPRGLQDTADAKINANRRLLATWYKPCKAECRIVSCAIWSARLRSSVSLDAGRPADRRTASSRRDANPRPMERHLYVRRGQPADDVSSMRRPRPQRNLNEPARIEIRRARRRSSRNLIR